MTSLIHVGTSGWHYPHWKGLFYPPDLPAGSWLAHYARSFTTVEVNNTFYRLPSPEVLAGWAAATPAGFRFAVKVSRYLTHFHRLRPRWDRYERFFAAMAALGDKLGPLLFQLPPRFPADPGRLDAFLAAMPAGFRAAFEFRDPSWLGDAVMAVLHRHNAALAFWDFDGSAPPLTATADFVYVRLHGPGARYRGSYDDAALAQWAGRARHWAAAGREVHCYFDNDDRACAVTDARRLKEMLTG